MIKAPIWHAQKLLLGNHDAENVVLTEIKPQEQKTRIDFCARRIIPASGRFA